MEVASKFRKLYLVRKFIFFFLFISFLIFTQSYDRPNNNNKQTDIYETIIFYALAVVFAAVIQLIQLIRVHKIVISETEIKLIYYFKPQKKIQISSIIDIQSERVQGSYSEAGQITSGYFQTRVTLSNNQEIIITPDKYENHGELVNVLRKKFDY